MIETKSPAQLHLDYLRCGADDEHEPFDPLTVTQMPETDDGILAAQIVNCPSNRMCDMCLFREGTWPNRSPVSVYNAVEQIRKGKYPFLCSHRAQPRSSNTAGLRHGHPVCRGFMHAVLKRKLGPPEKLEHMRVWIKTLNNDAPSSTQTSQALKVQDTEESLRERLYGTS